MTKELNRYQFHQAVHIAGRDYSRGTHEVSEKAEYDPVFLKYVGLGLICEAGAKSEPPTAQTLQERNKALHDRLVAEADKRKAAASPAGTAEVGKTDSHPHSEKAAEDETDGEKSHKEKSSHSDKNRKR